MSRSTSNLQIDSARLWGTIHETAQFGATPKGGVRRLTLSAEDKQVRDWFRSACEAAGLDVHVDALGSMFGLRRGRDMSKLPIGLGSHLDTQPTGGKYDGVLGTLAALEVVRTLNDAGIETDAPLCICNWTNEEGSRFAPAMMASGAYVGAFTTDDILSRRDADGVTVARGAGSHRLSRREPGGDAEVLRLRRAAHRTGPDSGGRKQDHRRGQFRPGRAVVRRQDHRLREPCRLDPDAAAARCAGNAVGNRAGDGGDRQEARPECGRHHRRGRDRQTLAQRHSRRDRLHRGLPQRRCRDHGRARRDLRAAIAEIAARRKVEVTLDLVWHKPPTHFDPKFVDAVENAATMLGYSHRRITSGAGHDACNLNTIMPAAMVFVPCKDGISHNELEDATQPDCAAGANVLMHTVLALAGVAS